MLTIVILYSILFFVRADVSNRLWSVETCRDPNSEAQNSEFSTDRTEVGVLVNHGDCFSYVDIQRGELKWTQLIENSVSKSEIVTDSVLLIASDSNAPMGWEISSYISALDLTDGSSLWNYEFEWSVRGQYWQGSDFFQFPTSIPEHSQVVFGWSKISSMDKPPDNNAVILDLQSGSVLWKSDTEWNDYGIYHDMYPSDNLGCFFMTRWQAPRNRTLEYCFNSTMNLYLSGREYSDHSEGTFYTRIGDVFVQDLYLPVEPGTYTMVANASLISSGKHLWSIVESSITDSVSSIIYSPSFAVIVNKQICLQTVSSPVSTLFQTLSLQSGHISDKFVIPVPPSWEECKNTIFIPFDSWDDQFPVMLHLDYPRMILAFDKDQNPYFLDSLQGSYDYYPKPLYWDESIITFLPNGTVHSVPFQFHNSSHFNITKHESPQPTFYTSFHQSNLNHPLEPHQTWSSINLDTSHNFSVVVSNQFGSNPRFHILQDRAAGYITSSGSRDIFMIDFSQGPSVAWSRLYSLYNGPYQDTLLKGDDLYTAVYEIYAHRMDIYRFSVFDGSYRDGTAVNFSNSQVNPPYKKTIIQSIECNQIDGILVMQLEGQEQYGFHTQLNYFVLDQDYLLITSGQFFSINDGNSYFDDSCCIEQNCFDSSWNLSEIVSRDTLLYRDGEYQLYQHNSSYSEMYLSGELLWNWEGDWCFNTTENNHCGDQARSVFWLDHKLYVSISDFHLMNHVIVRVDPGYGNIIHQTRTINVELDYVSLSLDKQYLVQFSTDTKYWASWNILDLSLHASGTLNVMNGYTYFLDGEGAAFSEYIPNINDYYDRWSFSPLESYLNRSIMNNYVDAVVWGPEITRFALPPTAAPTAAPTPARETPGSSDPWYSKPQFYVPVSLVFVALLFVIGSRVMKWKYPAYQSLNESQTQSLLVDSQA